MINSHGILETISTIDSENLDVRAVIMGTSLLDCADSDQKTARDKVYDRICRYASNLAKAGEDISKDCGIPIISKRISVTPISMTTAACPSRSPAHFAQTLDRATKEVGVNFIGDYSALIHEGFGPGDCALIENVPEVLNTASSVCSSVNVSTTRAGINMDAVGKMGRVIRECTEKTADHDCIGAAKLVVSYNTPESSPFTAGASHGPGEPNCVISVDVSGPGMVRAALVKAEDYDIIGVADLIKKTTFKITRMRQLVVQEISRRLFVPFSIVDFSLAPTPTVGDSVTYVPEEMSLGAYGAHGMTTTLALLSDAMEKGGIMASSHAGDLSGTSIPVTENTGMIEAARHGSLTLNRLEAMTAICSIGLDMIAIPGNTPAEVISGIIADGATIGIVNNKTTAVRLTPAIGKQVSEGLNFGGLLGGDPVMEVSRYSPQHFIQRGGRIPAPLQSLKN